MPAEPISSLSAEPRPWTSSLSGGEHPAALRSASQADGAQGATHKGSGDVGSAFETGCSIIKEAGQLVGQFCRATNPDERSVLAGRLQEQFRALRHTLQEHRMEALATLCSSLARLATHLEPDRGTPNPSRLRTVTNAIDFLRVALQQRFACLEVAASPLEIMIVDDSAPCRRAIQLALSSGGLRLCTCESAEVALEELKARRIDVIFTDVMMPGLNGFDFARMVREMANHKATPLVFVTSLSDFQARSRALLSGGCELIAKPITAMEIVVKAFTFALRHRIDSGDFFPWSPGQVAKTDGRPIGTYMGVMHVEPGGEIKSLNADGSYLLGFGMNDAPGMKVSAIFQDHLQVGASRVTVGELFAGGYKNERGVILFAQKKDGAVAPFKVTISETLSPESAQMFVVLFRQAGENTESGTPSAASEPASQASESSASSAASARRSSNSGTLSAPLPVEAQLENARRNLIRLEQRVAELERTNKTAQSSLESLSTSEKKFRTRCEALEREAAAWTQSVGEVRKQLDAERFGRAEAEKQASELAAAKAALEDRLRDLQGSSRPERAGALEATGCSEVHGVHADLLQKLERAEDRASAAEARLQELLAAKAEPRERDAGSTLGVMGLCRDNGAQQKAGETVETLSRTAFLLVQSRVEAENAWRIREAELKNGSSAERAALAKANDTIAALQQQLEALNAERAELLRTQTTLCRRIAELG